MCLSYFCCLFVASKRLAGRAVVTSYRPVSVLSSVLVAGDFYVTFVADISCLFAAGQLESISGLLLKW